MDEMEKEKAQREAEQKQLHQGAVKPLDDVADEIINVLYTNQVNSMAIPALLEVLKYKLKALGWL